MVRLPSGLITCLLTFSAVKTASVLDSLDMRKIYCLLLLLMGPAVFASNGPAVMVIGDSLSAGYGIDVDQSWTALLQERLQSQGYEHRVVNASITGRVSPPGRRESGSVHIHKRPANTAPANTHCTIAARRNQLLVVTTRNSPTSR
jgi:hypothetical protein